MPRGRRECGLRRATDVTAKLASAGQSGGQEDLGLPLQLNCSQEAKVVAEQRQCLGAGLPSVPSTPCVIQDLCWESSGLMSAKLCSWTLA